MNVLTIDGVAYTGIHVASIKRKFSVLDGDNAGRVMSGEMVRDIIGTYYNYTMEIDPDQSSIAAYDSLYEVLSAPTNYHTIKVPYGQGTLEFKAYVSAGSDELIAMQNTLNQWGGLQIDFVAMSPKRVPA